MASTIPNIGANSNQLHDLLKGSLTVDTTIPDLGDVDLGFDISKLPVDDLTSLVMPSSLTLAELTTGQVDGTGVFDQLMKVMGAHLDTQVNKNRLSGTQYSEVYLGSLEAVLNSSVQFLLGKDRAYWEAVGLRANALQAQVGIARAQADVIATKYTAVVQKLTGARVQIEAYTAEANYSATKLGLSTGYQQILQSEAQTGLINEQYDSARAETKDTLQDGVTPIKGIRGVEKRTAEKQMELVDKQVLLTEEQYETQRAQTKNTLSDGSAISGLVGVQKQTADAQRLLTIEQVDAARGQTKNTTQTGLEISGLVGAEISLKRFQSQLTEEQYETQRAQTKETLSNGTAIEGLLAKDKLIKEGQAKLISEQYEAQRGQVRGTLSTGETVSGVLGAQTALYKQQTESYKHDAMYKGVKGMLDTWTARKSLDDGVAVPTSIDTTAINTSMNTYKAAIGIN